ncbi:7566_t:CDS:2, partial [Dentiscutata erythropus]
YEDSGCHLWKLQVLAAILSFTVWFAEMSILVRFSFAETDMSLGIFVGAFVASSLEQLVGCFGSKLSLVDCRSFYRRFDVALVVYFTTLVPLLRPLLVRLVLSSFKPSLCCYWSLL